MKDINEEILKMQKDEITEHFVYKKLSEKAKKKENKEILNKISIEEFQHYNVFKNITKKDIKPNYFKIYFYSKISTLFGLNFGLKLMESGESNAQKVYNNLNDYPEIKELMKVEEEHEKELISMIEEDILNYVSSIVLGLNDALVELTGALTGFTLALQNTKLVAIVGLITGLAAAMSMGVSQYLSIRHQEGENNHPIKASFYTFSAYLITVLILVSPYILLKNIYFALFSVIFMVIFIIALFNFYISVAKGDNFKKRFFEMAILSLLVASINYGIGYALKHTFNIDV